MAKKVVADKSVASVKSVVNDGVQILNPLDVQDWDACLSHFSSATIFHSAAWARVLHSTYGYQPVYFAQGGSGRFQSLLPVMEVNSWLTGRRGVSLPFSDECEPLCPDAASFRCLYGKVLGCASSRAWQYWECRGGRALFGDVPSSTSFYGHRLELQGNESELFARMDSSVRRAVRKAEQSGLTVNFSQELDDVRTFHRLLGKTRQRHGLPVQPFEFFKNIHRYVLSQNLGWVVLARHGQVPVAGAVFFHFGRTAIYKFGASDESFQHLRANNFVMWQAIKRYAREGFRSLDFGRTSLANEGLRRFKLGWGTQEHRIDYVRYHVRTDRFVTARDESTRWYSRIFRVLPVFLSRLIGAALYKHIA